MARDGRHERRPPFWNRKSASRLAEAAAKLALVLLLGNIVVALALDLAIPDGATAPGNSLSHGISLMLQAGLVTLLCAPVAYLWLIKPHIAARAAAEAARRESDSMLTRTARMGRTGHWLWDDETDRFLLVSEELARLYGFSAEDYRQRFADLDAVAQQIHPEDRGKYLKAMKDAQDCLGSYDVEFRERTAGGEYRHFREYGEPIQDERGGHLCTMGIVQDITEFKRVEEALEDSKRTLESRVVELEEAQGKLERQGVELVRTADDLRVARDEAEAANRAKSDFLATMSHEIRTPMNGVLGMTTALLGQPLASTQREQLRTIKASGETLLALLNDILDLSKIEAKRMTLEPVDFSLRSLMEATESLWASRAQAKGLTFDLAIECQDTDWIRADETRLRQVLFNLVGNAIKFTEAGSIQVSVSATGDERARLRFEVVDSGIGVTEEQRATLFDPFQQADASTTRKYGGTGLGLAISKQLVELMGGEIGVESRVGGGSSFWFTLAFAAAAPSRAPTEADCGEQVPDLPQFDEALKLLAAEDNDVNRLVLKSLLAPVDCELDIVTNGREAVAAVQAKRYDLVLMDIQMPEMDGMTATRRIRALPGPVAQVPIIAFTANAMIGDRESYLDAGMNGYVSKPVDAQELYDVIVRASGRSFGSAMPLGPLTGDRNSGTGDQAALDDLLEEIDGLSRDIDLPEAG